MKQFSRRGFIGLLATGAVGACVAAKVPTKWLPERVRTNAACEFLRAKYNAWSAARGGEVPGGMIVGGDLYEAFEGEIQANMRFTSTDDVLKGWPSLKFKACSMYASGRGWDVRVFSRDELAVYMRGEAA